MQRGTGFSTFVLIVLVVIGFGVVLWRNAQPAPALRIIVPTQAVPTEGVNAWEAILQAGFGDDSTPLPTVAIPTAPYMPPTLAIAPNTALTPVLPAQFAGDTAAAVAVAATPTPPPTAALLSTSIAVTSISVTQPPREWQPPPLIPPISRDPLGRDHYWFVRPVDSSANNQGLFYYPYGSDGPEDQWRVHAGLDMPNPIGETVRAAGAGTVTFAANGVFQDTYSYGNVVRIQHDFGYDGQPLFTVYAHLSAVLVTVGQHVEPGDPIGLVGNTGRTTGPHVHFEVRLGEDNYGATVNPVLWMVPYVGTGTIAGRVLDRAGNPVMDADVTVREYARGLVTDTTTTYIFQGTGVDVNADPVWNENFAVGDVPAGRYDVIAFIDGERVSASVVVVEGTTSFVELRPGAPPTAPNG
jgi:murein DD-endopeptidase MepM/ murein hydrolase activator NlpD